MKRKAWALGLSVFLFSCGRCENLVWHDLSPTVTPMTTPITSMWESPIPKDFLSPAWCVVAIPTTSPPKESVSPTQKERPAVPPPVPRETIIDG
jgi:hypothetical protein